MPREVNATLRQTGSFGQTREFQILDGKELRIANHYKNKQSAYMVSLLALEDKGHMQFYFAWRWLVAAAVVLLVLLVFVAVVAFADLDAGSYAFPLIGGLTLLTVAFVILFVRNTCRLRVYRARHSNVELFRIRSGKPSHAEYKAFIEVLDSNIAKCREYWRLTQEQQLAGELRTLRRLVQEKVIGQEVYDEAKATLFALRSGKHQAGAAVG